MPQKADAPLSLSQRAAAGRPHAPYLQGLNPQQKAAVEALEGPVLVLAGAGTGKTRVLTTRIAHIIATGKAFPNQILSVTFTNKAAREMRERIGKLLGDSAEGMPWLGTFHSIGTKILRRHAELVGRKSDFTILDTDDQLRLMKQVISAANLDEKRWPARALAGLIDGWKNRGLHPAKVPQAEGMLFANGKGLELYIAYQERLKTLNACDFGDLLIETIRLFQENPDVLRQYQERFRFILVDEYQDTNVAQYLWLRLLAQGRRNLCCVGDDDQSIYGWRGAEVDNILRFEHDFPGAFVVKLENNYRSTGHILGAAARLIANNEARLGKTLFSEGEMGEKVSVASAWDGDEEARLIAEDIEALQHKQHNLNEMAILVRTTAQMRAFEERFTTCGIPYRVIGGPRFYERMEIRDAMAYFRATVQNADDLAFERILNVPKRGLAEATLNTLHHTARGQNIPLMQAATLCLETEEIKPKPRATLRELMQNFARWHGQLAILPHHEVCETILEESGYTAMWKADRSADASGRLENLKELVRFVADFESLQGFLEHVALVMEAAESDAAERVTVMTLHGAKGLEFETVYLPGWEEGLFPSQRSLDESGKAGLEEERRLAYVGLTRAKKSAKIWFTANRRVYGLWQASAPSRFIDELPEDHVEVLNRNNAQSFGGFGRIGSGASRFDNATSFGGSSYNSAGWQRAQSAGQDRAQSGQGSDNGRYAGAANGGAQNGGVQAARAYNGWRSAGSPPRMIEGEVLARSNARSAKFQQNARVFHNKFGPGTVALIDGNKLTVDFDKAGRKMVLDSFLSAA